MKVVNEITVEQEPMYVGDLIEYEGKLGLLCKYESNYYIQGFDGYVVKQYFECYSEIDHDPRARLICKRDKLVITVGKEESNNDK